MTVLNKERFVQAELAGQFEPLRLGMVLAQQNTDGIADVVEQREGDEADDEKHRDSLEDAGQDKAEHGLPHCVTHRAVAKGYRRRWCEVEQNSSAVSAAGRSY